ncbi:response regulator transcription factor [Alicyclobacillus sp. SO9]|uniref:response regulator n=1 Tax=Alicyclobacillus sp. SO9 TaxID=2665646 RepID=UPI0018E8A12A|nr:response regulator transcription factor [Alicyclobacillus sp. SO9]QQE81352.1 response regulator transcription factor [Alicyclobacillus sp. SO9]
MKPAIRLLLVDDHAMVREGLRSFLELAEDMTIVKEAETAAEAIASADEEQLDVIIMDLVMPGERNGIDAIRTIGQRHPDIRILALTSFQDESRILDALEAGAIGYLQKDISPDDLLAAVRHAAAGRTVLEARAMELLRKGQFGNRGTEVPHQERPEENAHTTSESAVAQLPPVDVLTQRESEILHKLALGYANKEIGAALGITEKTVKVHVSHILSKLGVYDRTQAVIVASKMGMVEL